MSRVKINDREYIELNRIVRKVVWEWAGEDVNELKQKISEAVGKYFEEKRNG